MKCNILFVGEFFQERGGKIFIRLSKTLMTPKYFLKFQNLFKRHGVLVLQEAGYLGRNRSELPNTGGCDIPQILH